jgi:hypothetical protein
MEELKKEGHSVRSAAQQMELEALKEYPEMMQEFNAERLRARYRYHFYKKGIENDMGENLPAHPMTDDEWPMCKKCGSSKVKVGGSVPVGEPGENGGQKYVSAPASHGLCPQCRNGELREQRVEKLKADFNEKEKEFEQTPIDPQADRDWIQLAERLEKLLTFDFAIGKISLEVFDRAWNAFRILYDAIGEVSELSQAPIYSE